MTCALAALAPCACDPGEPATQAKPDEVVRAYFASMTARDCAAATKLTAGKLASQLAKTGCAEAFHTFEEHGVTLVRVAKTQRDGRVADKSLVTVVLNQSGQDKRVVVAVKRIDGRLYVTQL